MIRRLSTHLLGTRREAPAGAATASHALLVRAGMLEQVGPGLVALAPLLARVVRRIEAVMREELAAAGFQEVRLARAGPALEEQAALLAAGRLVSHRQLPQALFQIATHLREEARPGSGLLRTRELTSCDAYAFDADEAATAASRERLIGACTRVFDRCGLEVLRADAAPAGEPPRTAFFGPAAVGDDCVAVSDRGYRARDTAARAALPPPDVPEQRPMRRVETPGATTMAALAPHVPDVPAERMVKTLVYAVLAADGSEVVAALCRGDRAVDERKLARALAASEVGMADAATIRAVTGAEPGFAGPVGLPADVRVVADHAVAGVQGFVCGANADDAHLRDVWWGRDVAPPELADLDRVCDGDRAPDGGTLRLVPALALGNVRPLGTRCAEAQGLTVAGPDGVERPVWMSACGIAVERLAAALVEQRRDDAGLVWPLAVAPHSAVVVTVRAGDATQDRLSEKVAEDLLAAGVDAVWDDRDVRAGVKFADAELIGFPWRITVGRDAADGRVELIERSGGAPEAVAAADAVARVAAAVAAARVPRLP